MSISISKQKTSSEHPIKGGSHYTYVNLYIPTENKIRTYNKRTKSRHLVQNQHVGYSPTSGCKRPPPSPSFSLKVEKSASSPSNEWGEKNQLESSVLQACPLAAPVAAEKCCLGEREKKVCRNSTKVRD